MTRDGHEVLREFVLEGTVLQMCTAGLSPFHCWYAADRDLSLVFVSRTTRHHSIELMHNPRLAGSIIHAIPLKGPGEKVRACHFRGLAALVPDDRISEAHTVYADRWGGRAPDIAEFRDAGSTNRLWRVTPSVYIVWDEVTFGSDPRREFDSWQ